MSPQPSPVPNVTVTGHNAMKQVVEFYGHLLLSQDQAFQLERVQYQARIAELEKKLAEATKKPNIVQLPEPERA